MQRYRCLYFHMEILFISYGQFSKRITLYICDKDVFFDAIMDQKYNSDVSGNSAGVEYSPLLDVELGESRIRCNNIRRWD